MSCQNKCGFSACGCMGIIISIVLGAVIGILFAFGFIPEILISLWVALGLAVLFLILLVAGLYLAAVNRSCALSKALCSNGKCLAAGSIGTTIAAILALSITLSTDVIASIVFITLTGFFFVLMLIALIAFISNLICKLCSTREN